MLRWLVRYTLSALYNQMAWAYDAVAWLVSFGQWKAWGRAALPHLSGQRILEMGHGPGHLLVAMHRRGVLPVGLDQSPNMGELARRRLRRAGLPALLVQARAQALPFRDRAFDSAVATFPTEFIIASDTLQEAARVLGRQGRVVIVPGIAFTGRGLPARFLEWLYTVTGQQDLPIPQPWAAITNAGFSLLRIRQPMGIVNVLIIVAEKMSR